MLPLIESMGRHHSHVHCDTEVIREMLHYPSNDRKIDVLVFYASQCPRSVEYLQISALPSFKIVYSGWSNSKLSIQALDDYIQ